MVETIGFPVTANQSSAGDYLPIDSDTLAGCTVTNSSAYAVEYSTGGAWTTIAAGGSATINTGAIATTSLRFRKKAGDSIPVVLSVAVTHPGASMAKIATDAWGNTIGIQSAAGNILPVAAAPKANWIRKAADLTTWQLGTSGTAATAVVDSTSPFGVPAIRLDIPNGNTYAQLTATGLSVPGYNAAAGNLTWVMYFERADYISQVQSIIGTSAFASSDTVTYNLANSDKHNHSGTHVINHSKTLAYDVVDVRMRIFGGSVPAGQTARVWFLGVYIPEPRKPFVMLTYDDADISFITKLHPQLAARGLKATFGINWADVGTNHGLYVDTSDLQTMYSYGHDFGSHNLTNTNVNTQGTAAYLADFDACLTQLKSRGWTRGNDYHPFVQGKHNPDLVEGLRSRGVRFQRNATTTDLLPMGCSGLSDPVMMPIGVSLTDTTSLATAKAKIDEAITYGQDVVIMGHVLAAAAAPVTWAEADHAALLDYCLLKRAQGLIDGVGSLSEWKPLRGVA